MGSTRGNRLQLPCGYCGSKQGPAAPGKLTALHSLRYPVVTCLECEQQLSAVSKCRPKVSEFIPSTAANMLLASRQTCKSAVYAGH